ncbi:phospholipase A2 inhibitor and Ly6/PLAUR domain-containing protein-like [Leptodactylus fuscus]
MISSTSCCYTDRCTPPAPVLPTISHDKNGVVCMSCQAMEASPCDSDTYMDCIGNETKCISQVIRSSGTPPEGAIRGCATPSLCNIPYKEGSFGSLTYSMDTTCLDGGASLHYHLYLLPVTFLCLFKVMN